MCVRVYVCMCVRVFVCACVSDFTGWRRVIGCRNLQVSFRKRATNCMALLRKETYKDKASYTSLPPCNLRAAASPQAFILCVYLHKHSYCVHIFNVCVNDCDLRAVASPQALAFCHWHSVCVCVCVCVCVSACMNVCVCA